MTTAIIVPNYDALANTSAVLAPTVNDDETAGYAVGSLWVNTATGTSYICSDPTTGAAVWTSITAGGAGGQTNTVAGSNGITNTGDNIDADLAPSYGTIANTICQGNDSRLSDARTPTGAASGDLGGNYPSPTVNDGADSTAIHDNVSGEISLISEKTTPVSADIVLIEDSAATNAKKSVQFGNFPNTIFGRNYVYQESTSRVLTTSDTYQDKVTLTTGAFTGTLRIGMSCIVDANNKVIRVRIYNVTNTTQLWECIVQPSTTELRRDVSAFLTLALTGSAKQIKLQWANESGKSDDIYISEARLETWRVS